MATHPIGDDTVLQRPRAVHAPRAPRGHCGFTLLGMLWSIGVLSVLLWLGASTLTVRFHNAQVRTAADAMHAGLQLARAEAVRRNRPVVFALTSPAPGLDADLDARGHHWVIATVPTRDNMKPELIRVGHLPAAAAGLDVDGVALICFNGQGRRAAVAAGATGFGEACTLDRDRLSAHYQLSVPGADRLLRVTVDMGGQLRMCDPAKVYSADQPEGCVATS